MRVGLQELGLLTREWGGESFVSRCGRLCYDLARLGISGFGLRVESQGQVVIQGVGCQCKACASLQDLKISEII